MNEPALDTTKHSPDVGESHKFVSQIDRHPKDYDPVISAGPVFAFWILAIVAICGVIVYLAPHP